MAKKSALGRGLGALIDNSEDVSRGKPLEGMDEIELTKIVANPWQPRSRFDEEKLEELAASIREVGVIQPLTVRKSGDKYELIAGERRFRASKIAGLQKVPAYVRSADDETMLEMALVENIQREDLDPIEIAISYQRLIDECKLTQESMSERVGKKRATVSNYLRLLKLPGEIQLGLRDKKLGMGHARAIIGVEDPEVQTKIYHEIVKNDYSVRKVEDLVREMATPKAVTPPSGKKAVMPEEYKQLGNQISAVFNTNVQFSRGQKGDGKIVIPFKSDEELERIIAILDKANTKE
ncbi:chromosome segregation DNA-binding protein [Saccharicrinis carchari]|uniref:Chromosome segregation DNA-binding protein n=1 Tax=Saccharicrinis carchari TaxID=1168039 RepID=A0A521C0P5_SACCC|nr:ParB/RepB/Spo0J family partition protein [Saccharicrinis carchari]SMO52954.1 chromosome segregation DNA-binding protein [Saccharicrinis carchari]